jgi:type VI protein secretion system component VasK
MRNWRRLLVIGALIAMALCFAAWFYREMMIDKCLDGGGAWDYAKDQCDK